MNIAKNTDFRRLTGIKVETFQVMIDILERAEAKQKARGGRKNKLNLETRLCMTLEYLREYRTYFHIGASYGLSESSAYKNIVWVENELIKSGVFNLPGAKSLLSEEMTADALLIDVTETPIQRPKKNKNSSIQAKKSATP